MDSWREGGFPGLLQTLNILAQRPDLHVPNQQILVALLVDVNQGEEVGQDE